jgi:hypothetical protein
MTIDELLHGLKSASTLSDFLLLLSRLLDTLPELDQSNSDFPEIFLAFYLALEPSLPNLLLETTTRMQAIKVILWFTSVEPKDGVTFGLRLMEQ